MTSPLQQHGSTLLVPLGFNLTVPLCRFRLVPICWCHVVGSWFRFVVPLGSNDFRFVGPWSRFVGSALLVRRGSTSLVRLGSTLVVPLCLFHFVGSTWFQFVGSSWFHVLGLVLLDLGPVSLVLVGFILFVSLLG